MKLRFRGNSLRFRINRREVQCLASGSALEEQVHFPGYASMSYVLEPSSSPTPGASFDGHVIRVSAPQAAVSDWAGRDSLGIYFELPANGATLKIAIEKDLECIDSPPEDRDPDAFPRSTAKSC